MQKIKNFIAPVGFALLPFAALAQGQDINSFLNTRLAGIIGNIISFLLVVAALIFIFGVIKYIAAGGDAEKTKEARGFIIFALVGLVIIFVFWGLVRVVVSSLGLNNTTPPNPFLSP